MDEVLSVDDKKLPPNLPPKAPPTFPQETMEARALKHRIAKRHEPVDWPKNAMTFEPAVLELADVYAPAVPEDETPVAPSVPIEPAGIRQARDARRERTREERMTGKWTPELVDAWLVEAFRILIRMPLSTRPKGHSNMMPAYMVEFADQVAQAENRTLRKQRTQALRKFGAPTAAQTRRMDQALGWQITYLKALDDKRIALYVGLGAFWRATRRPIKQACKERLGEWPSAFYKLRKRGLKLIADGLIKDGRAAT